MAETTGLFLADFDDLTRGGLTEQIDAGNAATYTLAAACHGTGGAAATFDGTNNEVTWYYSFAAADEAYLRCYCRWLTGFSANTSVGIPLSLRLSSTSRLHLTTYDPGTGLTFRRVVYMTDGVELTSDILGTDVVLDQWYLIELHFKRATADGANDGVAQCWIDGSSVYSNTAVDNDTLQVSRLLCGQIGSQIPGAGDVIQVDDVKLDTSYIGAYAAGGSIRRVLIRR